MNNRKISRWFAALLSAAILVSCMCFPALAAADVSSLNPDEKGSISVTMKSGDTTAADGTLTLYQVATLNVTNGNMSYTKTDDFAGFEGDLDVDDTDLAGALASYAEENGLTGTEAKISSDGEASFDDLTLGLFLIIQTEQSTGFYTIDPVLVTVPLAENNEWVYNVDASPKVQVTPEPGTTETMSIPVKVIWDDLEDLDIIRPNSATVVLEGTDGSARSAVIVGTDIDFLSADAGDSELSVSTLAYAVDGSSSDAAVLATSAGSSWDEDYDWDYIFEDLPIYDSTGAEIHYTLYEEPIGDYSITIDGDESTGFIVTNYHRPADDTGTTSSPSPSDEPTATEGNGGNGGTTSGTPGTTGGTGSNGGNNGGSSGTSGSGTSKTLPQTGQLNWPVALFAVLGVILVVLGIALVNIGGRKRQDAA